MLAANESFKDAGSNTAGFSSRELANMKRHLETLKYVFTTCKLELKEEEDELQIEPRVNGKGCVLK